MAAADRSLKALLRATDAALVPQPELPTLRIVKPVKLPTVAPAAEAVPIRPPRLAIDYRDRKSVV